MRIIVYSGRFSGPSFLETSILESQNRKQDLKYGPVFCRWFI